MKQFMRLLLSVALLCLMTSCGPIEKGGTEVDYSKYAPPCKEKTFIR